MDNQPGEKKQTVESLSGELNDLTYELRQLDEKVEATESRLKSLRENIANLEKDLPAAKQEKIELIKKIKETSASLHLLLTYE